MPTSTRRDRLARFAESGPSAARWTVIALLIAALGFGVQMTAGVTDTPDIPPGLVVILVAACLVAFVPGRLTPLAGVAAGLFNLVAAVAVDAADRLVDLGQPIGLIGAWLMHAGLTGACIAGTFAVTAAPADA